jgi:hypothetical protein
MKKPSKETLVSTYNQVAGAVSEVAAVGVEAAKDAKAYVAKEVAWVRRWWSK